MRLERIEPETAFGRAKFMLLDDELIGGHPIKKGFVTDGLTMPPPIHAFYDPLGHGFRAAVLHDFLLTSDPLNRRFAAHEFRRVCEDSKAHPVVRRVFYWGVRTLDIIRTVQRFVGAIN